MNFHSRTHEDKQLDRHKYIYIYKKKSCISVKIMFFIKISTQKLLYHNISCSNILDILYYLFRYNLISDPANQQLKFELKR
jgi:hypothetical protein